MMLSKKTSIRNFFEANAENLYDAATDGIQLSTARDTLGRWAILQYLQDDFMDKWQLGAHEIPHKVPTFWHHSRDILRGSLECALTYTRNHEILAFITFHLDSGEIEFMDVREDARRRGIGRALVRRAEETIRSVGQAQAVFCAVRNDPGALAFWTEMGYMQKDAMDTLGGLPKLEKSLIAEK